MLGHIKAFNWAKVAQIDLRAAGFLIIIQTCVFALGIGLRL
jgi:hypothetical protein